jgi:glucan biosynthesis protein C
MQASVNRIYFMDAMRSVLMMLGVVLHSAQVFNPQQSWLIHADKTTSFAAWLVEVIHTFRMPAFFVISGFFCALTLRKYKAFLFLKLRLKRIIVPVFFTAITLNLLQALILEHFGWRQFNAASFISNGGWVSHLWFLINLVIYFIVFAVFYAMTHARLRAGFHNVVSVLNVLPMIVVILLLPFLSVAILALNKIGFPLYAKYGGVIDMYALIKYLPYFAFGTLLVMNTKLLIKFSSINLVILLFISLAANYVTHNYQFSPGLVGNILEEYLLSLTVWGMVCMVFNVFHRFCNKPSPTWLFLSESSYTVYLFHHILVISFGLVLIKLAVPAEFGLAMLISTIIVITLAIQKYVILNSRVLRFMFNGK